MIIFVSVSVFHIRRISKIIQTYFLLILNENMCCDPSFKPSRRRDGLNDGHNICFYAEIWKIIPKLSLLYIHTFLSRGGWSGGTIVLGKLPVLGRPTNLDKSRARAYCACSSAGEGCLDIFTLVYRFSFLSPSFWETARYRLKYCLKGSLTQNNQPTNLI